MSPLTEGPKKPPAWLIVVLVFSFLFVLPTLVAGMEAKAELGPADGIVTFLTRVVQGYWHFYLIFIAMLLFAKGISSLNQTGKEVESTKPRKSDSSNQLAMRRKSLIYSILGLIIALLYPIAETYLDFQTHTENTNLIGLTLQEYGSFYLVLCIAGPILITLTFLIQTPSRSRE